MWLVAGCVGCFAGWVVWQPGLFVGCLASWGTLCGVCTLWCWVPYAVVCFVMSCLWVPCNYCHSKGGGLISSYCFCSSGIRGRRSSGDLAAF